MDHLGDITQISGYAASVVDCIVGGSPCQDLSIAGKRAGLAGARSGLFMEQIRIVKEMRDADRRTGRTGVHIRPRYMLWENVPGALSSNKSEDFRAVLEETARIADQTAVIPRPPKDKWATSGCIMGDGWSIAWRVLDAQFWGVPQRRRRIALVADFGGRAAPEILFVRKGLPGDFAESGAEGQGAARGVEIGFGETGAGYWQPGIQTLRAEGENRPSRPSNVIVQSPISVHLTQDPITAVTGTVCASGAGTDRPEGQANEADLCIVQAIDCRNHAVHDTSGTLQAKDGGGQSLNYINPVMVAGYKSFGEYAETDTAKALLKSDDITTGDLVVHNIVRRLTLLECERLQGYPDGWTDIGEWTDGKGKLHKESSDSARYKALGNSIAIPPWKWVLKRLCAQYERDATLGSLFDGIGGFPLIWEQLNGRGSCLWASEIEEFPIAATKYHFGGFYATDFM